MNSGCPLAGDGAGLWVTGYDLHEIVGKLGSATVSSRSGEMASGLEFSALKDVDCAARTHNRRRICPATSVAAGELRRAASLAFRSRGPRFFVGKRLFEDGQHVSHPSDVLVIQFRDEPHFFRQGFCLWLSRSKTRIASRPTCGASIRLTASAAMSHAVHRG